MAEVLYKIGDSGGSEDGDVISIKPDGYHVTWSNVQAWVQTGEPPAVTTTWPAYLRQRFKNRILRMKYIYTHTAEECAVALLAMKGEDFYSLPTEKQASLIARAEEEKSFVASDLVELQAYGLDTSWGWGDLKAHGVIKISDVDTHDMEHLKEALRSDDMRQDYLKKRAYRINFRAVLDAQTIADLEDHDILVPVDRETAFTKAQVVEAK